MTIISIENIDGGFSGFCTRDYKKYQKFSVTGGANVPMHSRFSSPPMDYEQFLPMWRTHDDTSTVFFDELPEVAEINLEGLKRVKKDVVP